MLYCDKFTTHYILVRYNIHSYHSGLPAMHCFYNEKNAPEEYQKPVRTPKLRLTFHGRSLHTLCMGDS